MFESLFERAMALPENEEPIFNKAIGLLLRSLETGVLGGVDGRLEGEQDLVGRVL